ncbi:hypothetical protein D3C87_184350 [compost metagenome]
MSENTIQNNYSEAVDVKVEGKINLHAVIPNNLNIVELADHLNVPILEKERQLYSKPFFLYPKDGLCGLL